MLLVGTHQIIAQLFQAFFFVNVANVPELVRTGKLDSLLVLPVDSQFAVSTKQFGLDSVVNAAVGGMVVAVALSKLGYVPGPMSILLYLIAIGFGIAETRCGYATGPRAGSAAGPPNTCHRVLPPIGASYSADISIARSCGC